MQPGPLVVAEGFQMHVAQADVLGVCDGEAPGGLQAVGRWLGIVFLAATAVGACGREEEGVAAALLAHVGQGDAAAVLYADVLDADAAHGMPLNAGYDAGIAAVGLADADVLDADVADR